MNTLAASPFDGLDFVAAGQPLKRFTWYRIGGPAKYFVTPRSLDELAEASRRCDDHGIGVYVLGLGANLLIRDEGIDAAVFKLNDEAFERVEFDGERVRVGAGVDLQKLIIKTARAGLGGLEVLAGIPATIGGALRMNAGGRYGEIGPLVESVTTMSAEGALREWSRDELHFAYRSSNIADRFIIGATLSLEAGDAEAIAKRAKEIWMYKRQTQPLNTRNSGCIFRNPPEGPGAGALIDRAGLKGTRVGNAEVSAVHANFIVAHPDCPSRDVLALIELVRDRVRAASGIELHTEVKLWPTAGAGH